MGNRISALSNLSDKVSLLSSAPDDQATTAVAHSAITTPAAAPRSGSTTAALLSPQKDSVEHRIAEAMTQTDTPMRKKRSISRRRVALMQHRLSEAMSQTDIVEPARPSIYKSIPQPPTQRGLSKPSFLFSVPPTYVAEPSRVQQRERRTKPITTTTVVHPLAASTVEERLAEAMATTDSRGPIKRTSADAATQTETRPMQRYCAEGIPEPHRLPTVRALYERYDRCWTGEDFESIPYNSIEAFTIFQTYNMKFSNEKLAPNSYGFLKKKIVPPGTRIFVRADLHGDLKSLLANLWALQTKGLLDKNFKCNEGVQLVFLGDYIDRGMYGMPILMLLATLKMANPDQVTLIRGNHEYPEMSTFYGSSDEPLSKFWAEYRDMLTQFCETMPLSLYVAEACEGKRQHVQFTHGTFEPWFDLAPLLDGDIDHIDVPKKMTTAPLRIKQIPSSSPLYESARRVRTLCHKNWLSLRVREKDLTAFNWGDVGPQTNLWSIGDRNYTYSPQDIWHFFQVSAENPVCGIFRGHQHIESHTVTNGKVVVSTLPVGVESPAYGRKKRDLAYVLGTAPKVIDWIRSSFVRARSSNEIIATRAAPLKDWAPGKV